MEEVHDMTRILEVDAEKAVVEFSLDRDLKAWPWTIEAMMKDIGDLAGEPELYAAVKDYLLGEYKQRVEDGWPDPPLWDFDRMYRGFVAGYHLASRQPEE